MALNISGANGNVPLDISINSDKVEDISLLQIPQIYTILGEVFSFIFQIVSDKQLLNVLGGKLSRDCLISCSLVTFPVILSVIWLSLISDVWSYSNLNVVKLLICGNSLSWLLNFILIFEIVDWGKTWLVNFNENSLFHFVVQITMASSMYNWMAKYLTKIYFSKSRGYLTLTNRIGVLLLFLI